MVSVYTCASECHSCQKNPPKKRPDCTPAISTLTELTVSVIAYSYPAFSVPQRLLFACLCHSAAGTPCGCPCLASCCFHCMPAHQCDFSQGQGWVMFVLVSFRKPAVSVCQGVTLGNLVCVPLSLPLTTCVCLCVSHCLRQAVYLCRALQTRPPMVIFEMCSDS